jgi:hypothetical protein
MFEEYYKLIGLNVIYLLRVEPGFYKFGVTGNIYERLRTHRRTLKFEEVVGVFQCPSKQSSFRIEQKFKRFARIEGILVSRYGKTEIICVQEPQKYAEWFLNEISEETKSLGILAIVDDVDFAPKIPKLRLRFDLHKINLMQPEINNTIKASKIRRFAKRQTFAIQAAETLENYNCENCGAAFRIRKHLEKHKRRKPSCGTDENSSGNHTCVRCDRTYSNKYNMAKHNIICRMVNGDLANISDPIVRLGEQLRVFQEEQREKEKQRRKEEERDKELVEIEATIDELLAFPDSVNVSNINNRSISVGAQNIAINNCNELHTNPLHPDYNSAHTFGEETKLVFAALELL